LNSRGVPVAAVWATGLVGGLAFFASTVGDQKIYQILYNASGLTGFLIWLGIAICHLRFRKAWVAQGRSVADLKFKSRMYPVGTWMSLVLFVVVVFGANIGIFQAEVFSWFDFITSYATLPAFVLLYLGHKWVNKTRVVPLQDCNFEMDDPKGR
jgi:amino acid permease